MCSFDKYKVFVTCQRTDGYLGVEISDTGNDGSVADATQVQKILWHGTIEVVMSGANKTHRGGCGIPSGTALKEVAKCNYFASVSNFVDFSQK